MAPRKLSVPTGLLPKVKSFWDRLSDQVLRVIEEALASENFKEKTWAVDWFFKHLPATTSESKASSGKRGEKPLPMAELEAMSEEELLTRIRDHLKDWEPD